MNILPKSSKEFARKEYWDQFFTRRNKSFEWYGEYSDLKRSLLRYVKATDNVLVVGCGNSSLSADLYDDGFRRNTSIDISEVAIKKMISKYQCNSMRPDMVFEVMDIFRMKYAEEQFNVVLDKGTLDALASDKLDDLGRMFDEIGRVLKCLGRYICVTLLQEHVLRVILDRFGRNNSWILRIHRCPIESNDRTNEGSDTVNLPVFVVIATKLRSTINSPGDAYPTIDIDMQNDGNFYKCHDFPEVLSIIDSAQKFEFLKYHVRNNKIEDENFHIELFGDQTSAECRYRLYFAQKTTVSSARCAVFIVPQGREHEWLFSTNKGRENLLKQCQVDRLVVVHLSRRQHYESMDRIKDELGPQVPDFFPIEAKKINFLSIGDEIGERVLLHQGKSDFSGEFMVEDVTVDEAKYRRLVFTSNRNIIQSEAKLRCVKSKKKKKTIEVIDHEFLSCDHHKVIAANLALYGNGSSGNAKTATGKPLSLALVGLGGGCFVNFLTHNWKPPPSADHHRLEVTVIEIDNSMLDIAQKWFDFQYPNSSNKNVDVKVIIEDGLRYFEPETGSETAKNRFDFIIFDVDSKNFDLGVSCPPQEFVTERFLRLVHDRLAESGMFLLNLVARNDDAKRDIYARLDRLFDRCLRSPIENDLNEIIICLKDCTHFARWLDAKQASQRSNILRQSALYIPALAETYDEMCRQTPLSSHE